LKVQLDQEYLRRATLLSDFSIMLQTGISVIRHPRRAPMNLEELAALCGSSVEEVAGDYSWSFGAAQPETEGSLSH
jgi:hypothetical protein